ncbi:MAG: DNA-directed RNA polymerase subunit D [Candidatus Aenigmatarchaeota archaeon]
MKIQVLSKDEREISFSVEDISAAFANELRRIMMNEVETMAVEWVDFRKNDSSLPDELVANRIGQIPITFDQKAYNTPEECECEGKGCVNCQVEFVLKKKGPGIVYSSEMKTKAKDVQPVFDKIPIVELFEGEELQFEAIAQLGTGKKHVKWQAAIVGYRNPQTVTIDTKMVEGEVCRKAIEKYAKKSLKDAKDKIVITDAQTANLVMQAVDICPPDTIKSEFSENTFVFDVESASGLEPEKIVEAAGKMFEDKMSDFEKSVGKLK